MPFPHKPTPKQAAAFNPNTTRKLAPVLCTANPESGGSHYYDLDTTVGTATCRHCKNVKQYAPTGGGITWSEAAEAGV